MLRQTTNKWFKLWICLNWIIVLSKTLLDGKLVQNKAACVVLILKHTVVYQDTAVKIIHTALKKKLKNTSVKYVV